MSETVGQNLPSQLLRQERQIDDLIDVVIPLGVAMVAQRDYNALLEMVLLGAKRVCRADGGTLYMSGDDSLAFAIIVNDTLGIAMGGTSGKRPPFAPLPLHDRETGRGNHRNVATHAALTRQPVNIQDAYDMGGRGFDGPQAFDEANGYRTVSIMTVPLIDGEGDVVGVLQLINARDAITGEVGPFTPARQRMVESLSRLAAAAMEAYAREKRLRIEIHQLHVQIDDARRRRDVNAITQSDYFQDLQRRAQAMRREAPAAV